MRRDVYEVKLVMLNGVKQPIAVAKSTYTRIQQVVDLLKFLGQPSSELQECETLLNNQQSFGYIAKFYEVEIEVVRNQ